MSPAKYPSLQTRAGSLSGIRQYALAERVFARGYPMNLCYCDESGTGNEPIAVMVGIVVDASRMHLTKADWQDLLVELSRLAGRRIVELHNPGFFSGDSHFLGG